MEGERCRKLSFLLGSFRCVTSLCDLDLTFHLAIVTLTYKILYWAISETVRCRKFILGGDIGWDL